MRREEHPDDREKDADRMVQQSSIRERLIFLALSVLVPAVLLAIAGSVYVYQAEQGAYRQSVRETVRAFALVVDKELARREEVLRSLAVSPHLDRPDLGSFYEMARRLAPRWDSVIVLADTNGQQVLNTRRPFPPTGPLPRNVSFPEHRKLAGPEATIVSDLYLEPIGGEPSFAIEVPVLRDGRVSYYLGMGSFASQMQAIFSEQSLPQGWTIALLDRQGRIVARNLEPEKHVDQPARSDLVDRSRQADEGFFETETRDGTRVMAFFSKVPRAQWTLAVGIPEDQTVANARNAALLVGAGTIALFAMAFGLAAAFGRGIVGPVRRLAEDAERLGRGEALPPRASGLMEVDRVSETLSRASEIIRGANSELRESEARFRALMDQAPFSIQIFSPDGRTVRVNPAWSRLWGVAADQIGDYNVLQDPQLEEKGVASHIRRAFAGEAVAIPAIRYDPNATLPDRTRHEDPVRYVSAVAYPLKDEQGNVRQVVLVHEDITLRRRTEAALEESEEKLRLLADTIPQLAWMAEPDGYIFWYNRRWYEYTGTKPSDMEGWGWQSVHDPRVLPDVLTRWKASIASGTAFDMVFPLKGADGRFRPFLTRVNPLRDADGRILYWFGTNTDISDIKRMEEALREADRRKDEFLATLAHELRNPLAPVVNSLEILKLPGLDAGTAQQARERMDRQVHHLVRLVDDLLDVSRVVRGKIELRKEPLDLATVITRAVETAQPFIDARGHRLDIDLGAEPLLVDGDLVRLSQVVGNLLNNAAKYTPPHGVISISARAGEGDVVLTVRDNGVGIAPDLLPRVFDAFVQSSESDIRSQGGLGIGLTLVKTLVELHGGTVEVVSDGAGKGSCFTIRLPRLPAERARPPQPPAELAARKAAAGRRILVVDDNRDAADSLATLLSLQGHDVRVAYDGVSSIAEASEHRPDLIFLDIGMPGMDGFETARRIRATEGLNGVRLVALTGWGQEEDRRRTSAAGFDAHLVKPPEADALAGILDRLG